MELVKTDPLAERFTIRINKAGQPVQRTLPEMTAGEVIRAFNWHSHDFRQSFLVAAKTWPAEGWHMLGFERDERVAQLPAWRTLCRFVEVMDAILEPHKVAHPKLDFLDLLKRHWPGRRGTP